ncbi:hypothetical protein SAMN05421788_102507 [Filimonas lacunae]|uniref:Peptide chain release factor 1 (ERF1) n=1 Tax=Filimonas lacunae TaxID=477680 RepID=A0A173MH91_9BACT|nr:hypothetical protein [Filimonas lacunae]BAV06859.1 hypothetical protein FLA_2879 [Filimonas lacunae]SIS98734.1 hypothetical protein SAMN05421788_102507 [Filimonas lacunae]
MIQPFFSEAAEVIEATHYMPAISIILPFEPKMAGKHELKHRLHLAVLTVHKQLAKNYSKDKVLAVNAKLEEAINTIDYSSYKKSIAIYVSPVFQKIYYLDIAVEEKIIIDETFEIRDLVFSKKDLHKYLVLVLNEDHYRFIIGNTTQFIHIINSVKETEAVHRDLPSQTGNFSDTASQDEIDRNKFLLLADLCLGRVLLSHDLPLFILGPEQVIGHFKQISHHHKRVIQYVSGSFEKAGEQEIGKVLAPYVANWKRVCQQNVLHKLAMAVNENKITAGIHNVWRDAQHKNGSLLVVEKNFMYPAMKDIAADDVIEPLEEEVATPFYIKDAVDDVIEQVLINGGDVEFVDEGLLTAYQKIALIRFF